MSSSNPYIVGAPIPKQARFIGRLNLQQDVLRTLQSPGSTAIVLFGQRCIGKTSLLLHLQQELAKQPDVIPLYIDLQKKSSLPLGDALFQIAQKISANTQFSLPEREAFDPQGNFFRESFLPATLRHVDGQRLVLLFDEFDVLVQPHHEQAGISFFPYLQELIETTQENLQFVCVLGRRPEELSTDTLATFKDIPSQRISFMSHEECETIVRQSETPGTLRWPRETIERLWFWTQGHPYFTQLACREIWNLLVKKTQPDVPTVKIEQIDDAIDAVLEQGATMFQWVWDGFTPVQQLILSALAELGDASASTKDLAKFFETHGVRLTSREIHLAQETLLKWDILQYRLETLEFVIPLLRIWICFEKPLQIVKEEIERRMPQVENLYKDGKNCYKKGDFKGAEYQLRRALRLNPYHLRARLLLGPVLVGQRKISAAVEEVELAYRLDPRLSKSVLIGTLLALARTQNESQRIATYYRVLDINPKQATALEKLRQLIETSIQSRRQLSKALMIAEHLGDLQKIQEIKTLWGERKTIEEPAAPKTIVVIEDSQYARTILSRELRKHGFTVFVAENAELGHLHIVEQKPELIILDLNLPQLAGDDFGVMLRGDEETKDIPLIIFSVRPENEIQQVVEISGAQGYIQKNQDMRICVAQLVQKINSITGP